MNYKQQIGLGVGALAAIFGGATTFKSAVYYGKSTSISYTLSSLHLLTDLMHQLTPPFLCPIVEPGHRAVKFNAILGVQETTYREGWNLKLPLIERPIIYDVRTHPKSIKSSTGSKGKPPLHPTSTKPVCTP